MYFTSLLAIVFITLKLTNYIDWSWFWVISPLLVIPAMLLVYFFGIFLTMYKGSK